MLVAAPGVRAAIDPRGDVDMDQALTVRPWLREPLEVGKAPDAGHYRWPACAKRPAYPAAFRGGSRTSYSPASNSTGFQDHAVRCS